MHMLIRRQFLDAHMSLEICAVKTLEKMGYPHARALSRSSSGTPNSLDGSMRLTTE